MAKRMDTRNDAEMVKENLRPPRFVQPDFSKTKEEKEALKKVIFKGSTKIEYSKPNHKIGRITIHVMNLLGKKDFKTTYSAIICESDISSYINSHNINNSDISIMYFAGKKIKENDSYSSNKKFKKSKKSILDYAR